jgi:hypothetical protein
VNATSTTDVDSPAHQDNTRYISLQLTPKDGFDPAAAVRAGMLMWITDDKANLMITEHAASDAPEGEEVNDYVEDEDPDDEEPYEYWLWEDGGGCAPDEPLVDVFPRTYDLVRSLDLALSFAHTYLQAPARFVEIWPCPYGYVMKRQEVYAISSWFQTSQRGTLQDILHQAERILTGHE